jgi:hypothetical protein
MHAYNTMRVVNSWLAAFWILDIQPRIYYYIYTSHGVRHLAASIHSHHSTFFYCNYRERPWVPYTPSDSRTYLNDMNIINLVSVGYLSNIDTLTWWSS